MYKVPKAVEQKRAMATDYVAKLQTLFAKDRKKANDQIEAGIVAHKTAALRRDRYVLKKTKALLCGDAAQLDDVDATLEQFEKQIQSVRVARKDDIYPKSLRELFTSALEKISAECTRPSGDPLPLPVQEWLDKRDHRGNLEQRKVVLRWAEGNGMSRNLFPEQHDFQRPGLFNTDFDTVKYKWFSDSDNYDYVGVSYYDKEDEDDEDDDEFDEDDDEYDEDDVAEMGASAGRTPAAVAAAVAAFLGETTTIIDGVPELEGTDTATELKAMATEEAATLEQEVLKKEKTYEEEAADLIRRVEKQIAKEAQEKQKTLLSTMDNIATANLDSFTPEQMTKALEFEIERVKAKLLAEREELATRIADNTRSKVLQRKLEVDGIITSWIAKVNNDVLTKRIRSSVTDASQTEAITSALKDIQMKYATEMQELAAARGAAFAETIERWNAELRDNAVQVSMDVPNARAEEIEAIFAQWAEQYEGNQIADSTTQAKLLRVFDEFTRRVTADYPLFLGLSAPFLGAFAAAPAIAGAAAGPAVAAIGTAVSAAAGV